MKIDVVASVYKPDKNFLSMIDAVSKQSLEINKIIILNVEQKFYDRLMYSTRFLDTHKNIEIHHISKREYDKGKSLNMVAKISDADYFVVMGQDVVPSSDEVFEKLLEGFQSDPKIAVSFARSLALNDAPLMDKVLVTYRYPETSHTFSYQDIDSMGNNAYMSSSVCAMYKKNIFEELGGFLNHVIFNEDVLYASKALSEGYKVTYVSDACVEVRAVPDEKQLEKLGFDYAVSVAKHTEVFDVEFAKAEIKKLEKVVISNAKRIGSPTDKFVTKRRIKAIKKGFSRGLRYKKIAIGDISKYSASPEYWRIDEILSIRNAVDVHSGYGRSKAEVEMLSKPPVRAKKGDS